MNQHSVLYIIKKTNKANYLFLLCIVLLFLDMPYHILALTGTGAAIYLVKENLLSMGFKKVFISILPLLIFSLYYLAITRSHWFRASTMSTNLQIEDYLGFFEVQADQIIPFIFPFIFFLSIKNRFRYCFLFIYCALFLFLLINYTAYFLSRSHIIFDLNAVITVTPSMQENIKTFFQFSITQVGKYFIILTLCSTLAIYLAIKSRVYLNKKIAFIYLIFFMSFFLLPPNLSVPYYAPPTIMDSNFSGLGNYRAAYSPEYKEKYLATFELEERTITGLNQKKNVIIVIIESYSAHMSKFFANMRNFTPKLDEYAKKGYAFTNFQANAYSTNQGLAAILTGYPSLHTPTALHPNKYTNIYKSTLPQIFKEHGYHTSFSSSSIGSDSVISNSGFDEYFDTDNPFYDGHERFYFNSVMDTVLFEHSLQWVKAQVKSDSPFLSVILTSTSHPPFRHPITGKRNYAKALTFASDAATNFIAELEKDNFFDNGILILTADHRMQNLVFNDEYEVLGPLASFRVPFFILSKDIGAKINTEHFSHIDIKPSLAYLCLPQATFNQFQNNMFDKNPEANLKYARQAVRFYQHLSPLDNITAYHNGSYIDISLNGDYTIISTEDNALKEKISSMLVYLRSN